MERLESERPVRKLWYSPAKNVEDLSGRTSNGNRKGENKREDYL